MYLLILFIITMSLFFTPGEKIQTAKDYIWTFIGIVIIVNMLYLTLSLYFY